MVTMGSILGDTFRFVRHNLPAITVWSTIYLAITAAMRAILGPMYRANAEAALQGVTLDFPFGPFLLVILAMLAVMLVLHAAVFRAVLFPERSAAFYLRMGLDEARLLGLMLALIVGMSLCIFVLVLCVGLVGGLLVLLGGIQVATGGIIFGLTLLIYGAVIFAAVRLSLAGPLTMLRGKIVIGPAWRLTRGKFWTLFGTYLVLWAGLFLITLLIMWSTYSVTFSGMMRPNDPDAVARMMTVQADQMALSLRPGAILSLLGMSVSGAFMLAFLGGAPAMATLQLVEAGEGEQSEG